MQSRRLLRVRAVRGFLQAGQKVRNSKGNEKDQGARNLRPHPDLRLERSLDLRPSYLSFLFLSAFGFETVWAVLFRCNLRRSPNARWENLIFWNQWKSGSLVEPTLTDCAPNYVETKKERGQIVLKPSFQFQRAVDMRCNYTSKLMKVRAHQIFCYTRTRLIICSLALGKL